jgi:hypothetical protein
LQAPAFAALGVTIKTSDNAKTVIDRLIDAQTRLLLLNSGIATIPKAKNPFEDWPDIIAQILAGIGNITSSIAGIGGGGGGGNAITPTPGNTSQAPNINDGSVADWRQKEEADKITFPDIPVSPDLTDEHERRIARNMRPTFPTPIDEIPDFGGGGGGSQQILSISVNVNGSVMTENDLVNSITNAIYNRQKSGQGITYSTAI